jgi:hypothetical protein
LNPCFGAADGENIKNGGQTTLSLFVFGDCIETAAFFIDEGLRCRIDRHPIEVGGLLADEPLQKLSLLIRIQHARLHQTCNSIRFDANEARQPPRALGIANA